MAILLGAALLLMGAFDCAAYAAVGITGGVTAMGGVASAAFNSTIAIGRAKDALPAGGELLAAATISSDPGVSVQSGPYSESGPYSSSSDIFHGRSLLHGCHSKRLDSRRIFLKCGTAADV